MASFPEPTLGASVSVLLPTGKWLVGSNTESRRISTIRLRTHGARQAPRLNSDKHEQTSWILLKDGSVLAYSPSSPDNAAGRAQRYFPATGSGSRQTPCLFPDQRRTGREVGTGTVLPNGKVLFAGGQ